MTGTQLRHLRESRQLTREQLASELGECTASTLNKWERDINPVPAWVEEKMLRTLKVTLPLEELHWLLSESISSGQSAESILAEAIRLWLHNRQKPTSTQNIHPMEPLPERLGNVDYADKKTKTPKPLKGQPTGGGGSSPDISQVAEEHNKNSND